MAAVRSYRGIDGKIWYVLDEQDGQVYSETTCADCADTPHGICAACEKEEFDAWEAQLAEQRRFLHIGCPCGCGADDYARCWNEPEWEDDD